MDLGNALVGVLEGFMHAAQAPGDFGNCVLDFFTAGQRTVHRAADQAHLPHQPVDHIQRAVRCHRQGTRLLGGAAQRLAQILKQAGQVRAIRDALRRELSWTHYRTLLKVDGDGARQWYMVEAVTQNWSTRALERQIGTLYYERLLASQDRSAVERDC